MDVEKELNPRIMRRRTYKCVLYDDGGSLEVGVARLDAARLLVSAWRRRACAC